MRKIRLFIASSLDGYIAREDGSIDWLFSDADYGYAQFYGSIDTVLVGRKTYDQARGFEEFPFKGKQVYVFSRNAGLAGEQNVEFVSDVLGFVKKLTQLQGRDIWLVGGSDIASILLNAGLVNEIILSVHPVVLGSGVPLFKDINKQIGLKLTGSIPYPSGLVQLHYAL